ncbi:MULTISPECIES: inositol monophosphatase family protein [Pseudovibrio]|uniref:inositol monophosphatase family protein n=1 Tax=Stappiaceae TaxID=2821832 RepID=UPI0023666189|nr:MULTISPECIES: inositol monophosphatase family protein [Pseudovibrio]MDD7911579.1 inositol monophosphatase family protein [Pseudovibrio exalbescens]MDX5594314.1 inositol monophosphatase family protein [Pseudovibrio sp. SPO723]
MSSDYTKLLELMEHTARRAGKEALHYFRHEGALSVAFKGQADFICQADGEAEKLIRETLQHAYPDIAFEGEEYGCHGPSDAELRWVVDPIDGTTNYISGLNFAVSIALVRGTEPLAGVIYEPVADEMFSATIGGGATMNGAPIKVRKQDDPARFVVGTGLPLDCHAHSDGAYDRLHEIREQIGAIRIVGACALGFAYVASGRLDGYFEGPTGFLDFAAGVVILREAGGIVTDFWGTQDFPENVTTTIGAPACQRFLLETTVKAPKN